MKLYTKKISQAVASSSLDPLGLRASVARLLSARSPPKTEISLTHSEAPWDVCDANDFIYKYVKILITQKNSIFSNIVEESKFAYLRSGSRNMLMQQVKQHVHAAWT